MKQIFDNSFFLGYVISVSPQGIKIHFPSSRLLNSFGYNGVCYDEINVGNYILIEGIHYGFLCRIIEINLPDSERKAIDEKSIQENDSIFHPIATAELLLSFDLFSPDIIEKTAAHFPHIGAKVFACSREQLKNYIKYFGSKKEEKYNVFGKIGTLLSHDLDCSISLNSIFTRHCAVVGTTGGGKSWTVKQLLNLLSRHTNNKVILIDATGEYKNCFNNNAIFGINTFFPYKYLSNSDFCILFQERAPNTVAALCDAINSLKLMQIDSSFDGIKNGKDSNEIQKKLEDNFYEIQNAEFDLLKLPKQIKEECVKIIFKNSRYYFEQDNFKMGYCSHLISRVNLLLNNEVLKKALGIDNTSFGKNIIDLLENFFQSNKQVLRIGFEELPFDISIREIIVDMISGYLLKNARLQKFVDNPLILFIDEAHQFINKHIHSDEMITFTLENVNYISKECRKHGLYLCLSTQMPRDIPIGTLSQIGTFIVHRLINEQDRKTIESACSSANKNVLSLLPILGAGEAILLGVDFPMPLTLKITPPACPPNSKTPALTLKS